MAARPGQTPHGQALDFEPKTRSLTSEEKQEVETATTLEVSVEDSTAEQQETGNPEK
jgi:hypothetical protein